MVDNISSFAEFIAALGIPLVISLTGTGLSIPLAKKIHILDTPGDFKVHSAPVPRFGGLGIFLGVVITSLLLYEFNYLLLIGAVVMAITGAVDDRFTIGPLYKVTGELTSGLFLALFIWTNFQDATDILLGILAIVLVLGLSNAVNLLDGLNGLAAGTSLISISGLGLLLYFREKTPVLALIAVGALAGFLVWNFPRAKTFMGDTGSLFTGYIIAVLLMELAKDSMYIFMIGVLMVAIPVFDTALGIIRRFVNKRPLFAADRGHFYDVMNKKMNNATKTVLIIYVMNLLFVAGGLLALLTGYIGAIIVFSLAIISLVTMSKTLVLIK